MKSVTPRRVATAIFSIEDQGNATLAVRGMSFAAKEALVDAIHVSP